jgi:protein-tyrosine phosphatase
VAPAWPQLQRSRELTWDGCLNVRDLGGHRTEDGAETRFGAIVRADSVRQLSGDGWAALIDYGVTTIVDLRGDHERQEDPPHDVPVEVRHVPFMEAHESEWKEIEERIEAAVEAAPDVTAATRDVYLIFLEHFHRNVAAGIRAVAHAPEGAVLIHCVGGKDRTGLLTAFLLHLAGVDTAQIADDYALSEERLRPRHEEWFSAAESDEELERLQRIAQTPAESMVGVFEELARRHGSVESFLRHAGVTDEELRLARARLRG